MKSSNKVLIILILLSGILLLNYLGEAGFDVVSRSFDVNNKPFSLNTNEIPTFWNETEILSPNLNISINSTSISSNVNRTYLYYTGGFFNNQPVRIFTEVSIPEINQSTFPALIFIPDFGSNHTEFSSLVNYYVGKGYVTITMDLPGFPGSSIGFPSINSNDFSNVSLDAKQSPLYLLESTVLRSISLAYSFPIVNRSQITLIGDSLGGLLAIYASVLDNRIASIVVNNVAGNFVDAIKYGGFFNGLYANNIYNDPLDSNIERNFIQEYDPLIYIKYIKIPILYLMDINNQFFSLNAGNQTYSQISMTKAISFLSNSYNNGSINQLPTLDTWLNYTLFHNTSIPMINVTSNIVDNLLANRMDISVKINSSIRIKSISLHYKENYMGYGWKTFQFQNDQIAQLENTSIGFYSLEEPLQDIFISVPPTWFITIELTNGAIFSSVLYVYNFNNILFYPWMISLGLFLAIPLIYQLYKKYKTVMKSGALLETNVNNFVLLTAEYIVIIGIQALFIYSTLSLPWFIVGYRGITIKWTLPNFLDFVILNDTIGIGVMFVLYLGLAISLISPRFGWLFDTFIGIFFAILTISMLSENFQYAYGFFLVIILPFLQLFVSIAFNRFLKRTVYKIHLGEEYNTVQ